MFFLTNEKINSFVKIRKTGVHIQGVNAKGF